MSGIKKISGSSIIWIWVRWKMSMHDYTDALIIESLEEIMKTLTASRMERCIGCHSCSFACARQVHKLLSWNTAGIRISSSGGLSTGFVAKICLACHPAPCAKACPTGAMKGRKNGGGVLHLKKLCIRCGECAGACPVDAIYLDLKRRPFVCIHCGRCVPFCPHECLELQESESTKRSIKENAS